MAEDFTPNLKQRITLTSYSILWLLILPFAIIHFTLQKLRRKPGYTLDRLSRYGIRTKRLPQNALLIHCASVGEVVAIQTLVTRLLQNNPTQNIIITTNTTTGADRVKSLFADKVSHAYLPYDFSLCVKRFIRNIRPNSLLINEMELWPNLCDQCWKAKVPVFLINGRMSEKSTRTYLKFPALFSPMFNKITAICAQSKRDLENYQKLGVAPEKLTLTNNIKFDLAISDNDIAESKHIEDTFNLQQRKILVAGSTHEPEEQILLDAYSAMKKGCPELLLIIVPRHPQRFEKVAKLLRKQNVMTNNMSQGKPCQSNTDVLLCDQMGKLRAVYALADISFVGGSLAERGGHNALEPAAVGVPILMGPSTYNNPAICQALSDAGALLTVNHADDITKHCKIWLDNPELGKQAGYAGKYVLKENSGAIQHTLDVMESKINS